MMTREELEERLNSLGITEDAYSLNGGLPNEVYCLNHNRDQWEVYYSEKGLKSGLKVFSDEGEACVYLFDLIMGFNANEQP